MFKQINLLQDSYHKKLGVNVYKMFKCNNNQVRVAQK